MHSSDWHIYSCKVKRTQLFLHHKPIPLLFEMFMLPWLKVFTNWMVLSQSLLGHRGSVYRGIHQTVSMKWKDLHGALFVYVSRVVYCTDRCLWFGCFSSPLSVYHSFHSVKFHRLNSLYQKQVFFFLYKWTSASLFWTVRALMLKCFSVKMMNS